MTPAQKMRLVSLIAAFGVTSLVAREGWRTTTYPDPVQGKTIPTACAGVTEGVGPVGTKHTDAACVELTMQALIKHAAPIMACWPAGASDADVPYLWEMTDVAYNVGVGAFLGSSMCREMKAGNFRASCEAILKWKYAGGLDCSKDRRCAGVWTRRLDEHAKCLTAAIEANGFLKGANQ